MSNQALVLLAQQDLAQFIADFKRGKVRIPITRTFILEFVKEATGKDMTFQWALEAFLKIIERKFPELIPDGYWSLSLKHFLIIDK
jgi:hypothetical protein